MTLREFGDTLCNNMTENKDITIILARSGKRYAVDFNTDLADAYTEKLNGTERKYLDLEQERIIYRSELLGIDCKNGKMQVYINL